MVRATFLVALFYAQKHAQKHENIFCGLIKINYIRIYNEGSAGLCSFNIYFYRITLFIYTVCLKNLAVFKYSYCA